MISFSIPGPPVAKGRGAKKASDQQIIDSYAKEGTCKKVAQILGMCAQSVHERLVKLNAIERTDIFTDAEKQILIEKYESHANSGTLSDLALEMSRTKTGICRVAGVLGLTDRSRKREYLSDGVSIRTKQWIKENGHPRGALGMKHSEEAKKIISNKSKETWANKTPEEVEMLVMKGAKTKEANGTTAQERPRASWKCGWREIGGTRKFYRSKWEANYAYYLQWLKEKGQILDWKHEPKTFWFDGIKRGCVSYLPDFLVTELSGSEAYHEVKGWMDDRSVTKIKRMAKYHPNVKLIVIDKKGYAALKRSVQGIVPGWEA